MNQYVGYIVALVVACIGVLIGVNKIKSKKIDALKKDLKNEQTKNKVTEAGKTLTEAVLKEAVKNTAQQKENAVQGASLASQVKPNMTEAEAIALAQKQADIDRERNE